MTTTTKDPGTLTPEAAWRRRVREAMAWASEQMRDDRSAGAHLHLCVLVTHVRMLELVCERRTEERDGLLEAAREAVAADNQVDGGIALSRLRDAIAKVEGE